MLAAIACGEHLLKHVQPMETGMAWPNARFESQPLTGFANGASGIACALLELAAVSGQERFAMVAKQAMAYERSLYSESDGKWPDLRPPDPDNEDEVAPGYAVTWAHGAAGIGLARLQAMRHLNDPQIRLEVDHALATTRGYGFGYNHSLSHGDLGNLELLFSAAQVLDDAELRLQTNRLAAGIMMSIDRLGWRCGVPEAVETPGLMLGLAGIGYQLLRLASPARVPCVLLLDPPPDV
jgi:lantibiotic modifying enzyme